MSCATLNQGATSLSISMASLPEGFCPVTMQEWANAIAARLLVSPNQDFNSFAIGSDEPSSNVGPWLKDCLAWFVFDDATARYVPIRRGFDSMEYFSTPGAATFIVPDNIYRIKIHAWGAGGGGSGDDGATSNGSGGGGGGFGVSIVDVTPGQTIAMTIGAGGTSGPVGGAGGDGSSSTILGRTAAAGTGSTAVNSSGTGGTATGFQVNISGQNGSCNYQGQANMIATPGGDAGGWGGAGGTGVTAVAAVGSRVGIAPGGGGGGGSNSATSAGGAGANGGILIEY